MYVLFSVARSYYLKVNEYSVSDGQGLSLLVKSNGTKLWIFVYESPTTKKRRKTSFGIYPQVTLKNARNKRTEFFNLIHSGVDPIDKIREEKELLNKNKNQTTFLELTEAYFDMKKDTDNLKEITIKKDRSRLNTNVIDKLPKKEQTVVTSIDFKMLDKIIKIHEKNKKFETVKKIRTMLVAMLKYAYTENKFDDLFHNQQLPLIYGMLEVVKYKKDHSPKSNPTFTNANDIKEIYINILTYKNSIVVRFLLLMTIHTAQRQGAIIKAKWDEIDFDKKLWIIPKENMKGRNGKVEDHHLPLSDVLINYLKQLRELSIDNEYLFPSAYKDRVGVKGRNYNPYTSNNTVTKALRIMGYTNEQQTAHGFRAMFKTVCKEHQELDNIKNEFVERVLSHTIGSTVEETYNRAKNIEDMRMVVNWWSEYLESLIEEVK